MKLILIAYCIISIEIVSSQFLVALEHDSSQISDNVVPKGLMARISSYFTSSSEKSLMSTEELVVANAKKVEIQRQKVFSV